MNSPVRLLLALLLLAILCVSCGGSEDTGDLESFCGLVEQGVGTSQGTSQDFEQLRALAPPEIRDVVRKLGNSTKNLEELEEGSLEEFFDAAFDPSAVKAQEDFLAFINDDCSVDVNELQSGPTPSGSDVIAELRTFVNTSFSSQSWVDKVRFDLRDRGLRTDSVQVEFILDADDGESATACEVVSAYLYDVANETGTVQVLEGKVVVMERLGPDDTCSTP